jgi:predicted HD superfamily hydrolase involved in NAD metabolism
MEHGTKPDPLLETADALARERLSEKRYDHTLRVADTAEHLARVHGLDLHDAVRETGPDEFLRLAGEWNLPVGEIEKESPKLLHGPVAAEFSRRELGVEDEEVLDAIRAHTTGRPGMGPLALVLYIADKIEPARDYPSVGRLRELSERNLRATTTEALRRAISYNEKRGKRTHPSSRATLEWLEKPQDAVHGRVDQVECPHREAEHP